MNKQEFIKCLNDFYTKYKIDPKDCYVSHGGSMLMLGLAETTNDIDLSVTWEVYNRFAGDPDYLITPIPPLGSMEAWELIKVTDYIDIHPIRESNIDESVLFEENNVRYRNMKATLEDYLAFNRPKDQPRIKLLRNRLDFTPLK